METREKILDVAMEQFSRFGVRNITMDDVARSVGISKKTLYQEFTDKRELVMEAFRRMLVLDKSKMSFVFEAEDGVIEHLVSLSKMMRERLGNINPIAIMEVQKYFPEAWGMFEKHKEEVIMVDLINILEKGKKLGYFRSEIDSAILARLRVNQITSALEQTSFHTEPHELVEMQMEMMDHFLHGIFTEKGRQSYYSQQKSQA
ncbi:MAG: TetR/AcrR family transcriptional regulator [Bacteroidota bacterium]|uniref:Transcriptional regulator, TetR family n=1 Tax=Algoriphagus faecimaris TaxID=686796 RepID=A0A1G6W1D3_9BACT|nr:TetR/AcrR family transcriptional regulator [Algoriphagus faecimaris]SDD59629.1 transcriptional regulator, TetR family [Algoriphagus faecimaris]